MSAIEVRRLEKPGLYAVGGVPGLALQVLETGGRTWTLRAMIGGRRRDMGLGGFPGVTLAKAREQAAEAREKIRKGIDPIEEQQAARRALHAAVAAALTFDQAAEKYIEAHEAGWRNEKHGKQWRSTLAQFASPVIGHLHVRDIELPHILTILEPIWSTKTETASRLRGRMESVLDWSTVRGYRHGLNPARWKGHLDALLAAPTKVAKVEHHEAMPVDKVAAFMATLRQAEGMGARALEFAILTAARSGEVRGLTAGEIDRKAKVWTVPAGRMKGEREHRVPLSEAALDVLKRVDAMDKPTSDFVFPAPKGGALSDMTLSAVMRRMKLSAVPHGFRSTFRDWAAERTNYPHEVAEMALAHAVGDKVEAAYRRGDLFEKRRNIMNDWAAFLAKPAPVEGKVVPISGRRKRA